MQKGFATLEIIMIIFIIGVLMTCAVPNAVKIIDKVSLDYETKRLYSELRFIQALNRSATVKNTGMKGLSIDSSLPAIIRIDIPIENSSAWQIFRGTTNDAKNIREKHYLSYGVKLSSPEYQIYFYSDGKSSINTGSLTLTSRHGKKNAIIIDTVGRIRCEK